MGEGEGRGGGGPAPGSEALLFTLLAALTEAGTLWARGPGGGVVHLSPFRRVRPFVTPWTVARQAPPSMGFSRQEHWGGLPSPPPGVFPTQGSNLCLLDCRQILSSLSCRGSPTWCLMHRKGRGSPGAGGSIPQLDFLSISSKSLCFSPLKEIPLFFFMAIKSNFQQQIWISAVLMDVTCLFCET